MAGMGPPPKHPTQRRRTNTGPAMTQLPAEGRTGTIPRWPLARGATITDEVHSLELDLWRQIWALPQATQWELLGWTRDVAQYARLKVLAELGSLDAAKEARQWSDRLGLTPLALLRLRWEIVADLPADEDADQGDELPENVHRLFHAS